MSRCICCNKLLNDRELHWKDSRGNFRDSCAECLSWIQNPDQDMYKPEVNSDEDIDDDSCIVYDISTDTDLEFDK